MTTVVLWLGGNPQRGYHAVDTAKAIPGSILLISSEGDQDLCYKIIDDANFPRDRVIWDTTAWDTVTNFTLTYKKVRSLNPSQVIVVTEGFHMRRSMLIASAVYYNTGINVIAAPSSEATYQEPNKLVYSDLARATLWRATGIQHIWTKVYQERMGKPAPGSFVAMS